MATARGTTTLLEGYEPGMRVARLTRVERPARAPGPHGGPPRGEASRKAPNLFDGRRYDRGCAQWRFTMRLLKDIGFDLEAGRQDWYASLHGRHPRARRAAHHARGQDRRSPPSSSTIHEAGHGLFEQGLRPSTHRTPLAAAPPWACTESQSRLWGEPGGAAAAVQGTALPLLRDSFRRRWPGWTWRASSPPSTRCAVAHPRGVRRG